MKFGGVIFDLDGTLVNTLEDLADSMNRILSGNGFPIHELESYKHFVGKGIKNLVIEALPKDYRQEEVISNCFTLMMEDYREHCLEKTRLYDGIAELLDQLEKHPIKLSVLSNKADELTKKIVKELLGNRRFDVIMGNSPHIPRKPDPTGALLISKKLGLPPERLLYVGDSGIDMNTANSAGMLAVGVLWGFRSKEELLENGAKMLLRHPMDLMEIL